MAFAVLAGSGTRHSGAVAHKAAGPHAPRMGGDAGTIRTLLMSFPDQKAMQRNVLFLLLIPAVTLGKSRLDSLLSVKSVISPDFSLEVTGFFPGKH